MAVGILLLTHVGLGQALVGAARGVVGSLSLKVGVAEFTNGEDSVQFSYRAARELREVDQGEGVLVLSDVYGATPSNIGAQLIMHGIKLRRVSGVNLPMLLRVLNYPEQALDEITLTAAAGARTGVVVDTA